MEKANRRLGHALIILAAALNAACLFFLPDAMAVKVTSSGAAGYPVPRTFYLLVSFIVIGLPLYASGKAAGREKYLWLVTAALAEAANIAVITANILGNIGA